MKTKTKQDILEEYIKFKSTNVTTQSKLNVYRTYVRLFLDASPKPLKNYQESDLVNCLNNANKRYNTRSMNEVKTLLKNFLEYYYADFSERFRNRKTLLRHLRIEPTYTSRDMLSKEQVEKIIKGEESTMWKTFWLVQFYGGMRPHETAVLKWDDITFTSEGAFIEVYVKKNQKKFTKFLPENVAFYLRKLQESSTSELVFPSRIKKNGQDMPMQRSGINKRLKILSKRVLGREINPYLLRHSIATILYNEDGVDKDFVAQQMGHTKNMESTYSHLDADRIKEKLKKLYIKTEETPEKKKANEERIALLEKQIRGILKKSAEKPDYSDEEWQTLNNEFKT